MKFMFWLRVFLPVMALVACSESGNDNVFQPQVEAVRKAEEVENKIMDAAARQRRAIGAIEEPSE